MKKKKINLFIFIDAFGWEILKKHPNFLKGAIVDSKRLQTILGYSNACDPSIISGLVPSQHLHWSSFYYSPETCPYKWVRWLKFLPPVLTNYHKTRHYVSKLIKKIHGFTGYFQIYNVPFKYLPYFDYAEKKRIWEKNGLQKGKTIFNYLEDKQIPYYVGDLEPEEQQLDHLKRLLNAQAIDFAYILLGKLDALMHTFGTHSSQIDHQIVKYDRQIRDLIKVAERSYEEVDWYVFSDHGMHNIKEGFDLQGRINNLGLKYGSDYVAVYDSTMARFWFLKKHARKVILNCLEGIDEGRLLSVEELKDLGVYFPDHRYGEEIFLMNPGILIVPSFMGLKKIGGMHGYHPDEKDSYAMICSNRSIPDNVKRCEQIFNIMFSEVKQMSNVL